MPDNEKILIVDDEPRMCDSLKELLSTQGYDITTCCNGHDALVSLAEGSVDLVLLDIVMDRMNGFQLMEKMACQCMDIPVIVMTGNASTASAVEALRKGAFDYLRKPFEPEELFISAKNALNQRGLRTDNHRVTKKLKESEKRFLRFAENAKDVLYRMSLPDGRYEYVSPASIDLFGYTPEEFYESPLLIQKVIHPDCGDYFKEQWAALVSGILPPFYEYQIVHKSGEKRWLHQRNALIRDENGRPVAIEGIISDITERKRVEEALTASENKYRKLVETISDVIYEIDEKGTITYVSPVGLEIWKKDPSEIIGRNFIDLVHPEDRDRLITRFEGLKRQVLGPETYRFVNEAGDVYWVRSLSTPVMENGIFKGARGILSDITAQKLEEEKRLKLEKRLQQAQKAESLGRMAGAIAHQFNNQLAVIMGNLELVLDDSALSDVFLNPLTQAMTAAHKAAGVSGLMLTYLGQTIARKEPMDVCEVCRLSLPLLRAVLPKRILLDTHFASPGPMINGAVNQIQQILTHLVTNAQEAVGDGLGAIELNVKTVLASQIPAGFCFPAGWQPRDKEYACMEVADAGCGIAEKDIDKIFDPFFTSKFTGRGLGLPVVLGIVKAHHGAMAVESAPGRGAVFRVYLPLLAEAGDHPRKTPPATPGIEGWGTALLIEDEDPVRKMEAIMLTRLGVRVLEAKSGEEAVAVFRRHRHQIRWVLCDLTMPGMTGWETITALRTLSPDLPVVLASGYDEGQVMADDHPHRPDAFLHKPFFLKELGAAIRQALAKK